MHDETSMISGEIELPRSQRIVCGALLAGRYYLHRVFSVGRHAVLWLATDRQTGAPVIVKIANDCRQRFTAIREPDPAFVAALAHGVLADGRAYVVLEYVDGVQLRCKLGRGFDPSDVLSIIAQLASALAAAHAQGVAHGSLTPEHILLVDDSEHGSSTVRVLGLGTSCGELDPGYAAPEQLAGLAADERSDGFAFAALVVELLSDVGPFASLRFCKQALLDRRRAGVAAVLSPHVPERLRPILLRALAPDPSDRSSSIVELAFAIGVPIGRRARGSCPNIAVATGRVP
jgi:serine/threonine protein kinase